MSGTSKIAIVVGLVFIGLLIGFVLNNWTLEPIYEFASCSYNIHSCEYPDWSGICTSEITDKCCMDVRMCGGQITDDPMYCLSRYCTNEDYYCKPVYQDSVQGVDSYKCTCTSIYEPL